MAEPEQFVDIHCHLLPGIDDGARDWDESLAMARMAVADGIGTIIATPHQLGSFAQNDSGLIRERLDELRAMLARHDVPLRVLPGADVRIEAAMPRRVLSGEIMSLGDHRRHLLLELPHELYIPIECLLAELASAGITGILSHPERNQGILARPEVVRPLVRAGCLMQVTAGSLLGAFGPNVQQFSEWILGEGLVHFISTDAHGTKSRRPMMRAAFDRVAHLTGRETALALCSQNGAAVAAGQPVATSVAGQSNKKRRWFAKKAC